MPSPTTFSRRSAYRLTNLQRDLDVLEILLDTCDRENPLPPESAGWARRLLERCQLLAGLPRDVPDRDANPFEYLRALIILFDRRKVLFRLQQQALMRNAEQTYPRTREPA